MEDLRVGGESGPGRLVRQPLAARASRWPSAPRGSVTTSELSVEVHESRPPNGQNQRRSAARPLCRHPSDHRGDRPRIRLGARPARRRRRGRAGCRQHRCWPVLAGPRGADDIVLGSPIILYDHPEVAPESAGALFDSTEIDEILTLRVMTMTDEEKAEARATDPRAAGDHRPLRPDVPRRNCSSCTAAPAADPARGRRSCIRPTAVVRHRRRSPGGIRPPTSRCSRRWMRCVINGVSVSKDSLVRVHPTRRADAQDLFFADQLARVTAVLVRRRRRRPRGGGAGRRPGGRPARLVRPLSLLRPRRTGAPAVCQRPVRSQCNRGKESRS